MESSSAFVTLALLIEELKSENVKRRVNSVKQLNAIAQGLGKDRARTELIPFLSELMDDDDEVLLSLAESLGDFVELIGGSAHAGCLLAPLEQLCFAEDSNVREKAIESIKKVVARMDVKKNEQLLVGMIKKLVAGDHHSAKSSAATLIPALFSTVSPASQGEFSAIFLGMANDEVPAVRKSIAYNLKDIIKLIPAAPEKEITKVIEKLSVDDQDFVRMFVVEDLVALARMIPPTKHATVIIPCIKLLAEDQSWRIRYVVCDKIYELGTILGKDTIKKMLLPYYTKYLQDPESELRNISCLRMGKFCSLLEVDEIIQKIIPLLKPLANDALPYVRSSMASGFLALAPLIGKKNSNDYILSIFLQLLKDENSEVRASLFKSLEELTKVTGIEALSAALISVLVELAGDKNFRVRRVTCEFICFFAKTTSDSFLNEKISKLLTELLADKIYGVREAAVTCLRSLAEIKGSIWTEKNILPKVLATQNHLSYLHRMTTLFGLTGVIAYLSNDTIIKVVLPVLQNMCKDPIPNVRLNVAKTISAAANYMKDKAASDTVHKILNQLASDSDQDVSVLAKQTLEQMAH